MRNIFLTTALTLLTFTAPTTPLSLLSPAPAPPSAFEPPTRNWARGDAKVALQHQPLVGRSPAHDSLTSASSPKKTISEHKLISNICDANPQREFKQCYEEVKKEIKKSVGAYCEMVEERWEGCMGSLADEGKGKEDGGCEEERKESEGCVGVVHTTYAYCLTYAYTGLSSTTHCANTELSLLPPTTDPSRPLLALRAPIPQLDISASAVAVAAPVKTVTIFYYTNASIAFSTLTTTLPVSALSAGYKNVSISLSTSAAGRNGTYSAPASSSTSSTMTPTQYTSLVSSLQAGTIPSDVPVVSSSVPAFGTGNRVGVFTTKGEVCTRYVGVFTVSVGV